jgi:hypothetical protein
LSVVEGRFDGFEGFGLFRSFGIAEHSVETANAHRPESPPDNKSLGSPRGDARLKEMADLARAELFRFGA